MPRLRGRRGAFYSITALYRKDPKPLREDLPKIFALLAEKKIDPLVTRTFPLLEARQALELLATGSVGNPSLGWGTQSGGVGYPPRAE